MSNRLFEPMRFAFQAHQIYLRQKYELLVGWLALSTFVNLLAKPLPFLLTNFT